MVSPVLVTGGTGRLGKLVVERLQDSGCDVRVLARHDRPTPQGIKFFTADLRTGTRAVRNGALLPPPGHTIGSRTWDQFLAAHACGAIQQAASRCGG